MPTYFFDTHDGDTSHLDDCGIDLPDRETARAYALAGIRDMANDYLPDGDRRDFVVNVRREEGPIIYSATMSLVGRRIA